MSDQLAQLDQVDAFQLTLPLANGAEIETTFRNSSRRGLRDHSWIGEIAGEPSSQVSFTVLRNAFALHAFSTTQGELELRRLPENRYRLSAVDPNVIRCAPMLADVREAEDANPSENSATSVRRAGFGDSTPGVADEDAPPLALPAPGDPEIDILVLYTAATVSQLGSKSAVIAQAQNGVNSLNATFVRSGVNANARLVHTHLTDYVEAAGENVSTSLTRLTDPDDGHMDEAHGLRTAYGADIVSVFTVGTGFGIGGINGTFSAVEADVGSGVAPHEWGHNLGCGHDEPTGPTAPRGVFSFSLAHSFTVNGNLRGTIMSYVGSRIAYFSNPNVQFTDNGDSAATGVADQRDHARTINENAANVAARRTVDPDDFDQDGVANVDEPAGDADLDGILNERDEEADGDGIGDGAEQALGRNPYDARALFTFAAADGWTDNNTNGLTISGGAVSATAATNDPQLTRKGLRIPGSTNPTVRVRMTCSIATSVQLYWGRAGADNISAGRLVAANYTTPGQPQTLVFDLSGEAEWSGQTITRLRLDPINGGSASGATFSIDFIATTNGDFDADSLTDLAEGDSDLDEDSLPDFADPDIDGDGTSDAAEIAASRDRFDGLPQFDFDQDGGFEGWAAFKHIDAAAVASGSLGGTLSGNDSQWTREILSFDTAPVQSIVVRARSSASGSAQLFWRRTSDGGFAGSRSISLPQDGSGSFRYLRFPVSTNAEWTDRITRLRYDPVNAASGNVAVDFIRVSTGDFDSDTLSDTLEGEGDPDNDLIPNYADPDSDNDGMTDEFEAANGLNRLSAADAAEDDDGDGSSNLDEFVAGTAISNPSDQPAVATMEHTSAGAGSFQVSLAGKAGRHYQLQRRTSLSAGMWENVSAQGPLATNGTVTLTDPVPPPGRCFYHVVITRP